MPPEVQQQMQMIHAGIEVRNHLLQEQYFSAADIPTASKNTGEKPTAPKTPNSKVNQNGKFTKRTNGNKKDDEESSEGEYAKKTIAVAEAGKAAASAIAVKKRNKDKTYDLICKGPGTGKGKTGNIYAIYMHKGQSTGDLMNTRAFIMTALTPKLTYLPITQGDIVNSGGCTLLASRQEKKCPRAYADTEAPGKRILLRSQKNQGKCSLGFAQPAPFLPFHPHLPMAPLRWLSCDSHLRGCRKPWPQSVGQRLGRDPPPCPAPANALLDRGVLRPTARRGSLLNAGVLRPNARRGSSLTGGVLRHQPPVAQRSVKKFQRCTQIFTKAIANHIDMHHYLLTPNHKRYLCYHLSNYIHEWPLDYSKTRISKQQRRDKRKIRAFLVSQGIEPNPGPINRADLERAAKDFKRTPTYEPPKQRGPTDKRAIRRIPSYIPTEPQPVEGDPYNTEQYTSQALTGPELRSTDNQDRYKCSEIVQTISKNAIIETCRQPIPSNSNETMPADTSTHQQEPIDLTELEYETEHSDPVMTAAQIAKNRIKGNLGPITLAAYNRTKKHRGSHGQPRRKKHVNESMTIFR